MKVIADTPFVDFVKVNGKLGFRVKSTSVAIMPYTVNESGIVEKIGILKEWNPLREEGYSNTLITGTVDASDEDVYSTAVRELYEEGGIDLREDGPDRWVYLGNFHDSKDSDRKYPTFAVDVTGKMIGPPKTDGSDKEENSTFELQDVNTVLALSTEYMVLGSFLRLFNIMYQKSFKNAK